METERGQPTTRYAPKGASPRVLRQQSQIRPRRPLARFPPRRR
jgi:hypothetical protein